MYNFKILISVNVAFLRVFFIKALAGSVAAHTFFDQRGNTLDETAATFEQIDKHLFTKRVS